MACCYALHAAVMFGAWVKGEVDSVIDELRICSRRTVFLSWVRFCAGISFSLYSCCWNVAPLGGVVGRLLLA